MAKFNNSISFTNIYKVDPTYVHSHLANFELGIKEMSNVEENFEGILQETRKNIAQEVLNQLNFFKKLETALIEKLKAKEGSTITNKESYIKRHNSLIQYFGSKDSYIGNIKEIKISFNAGKLNSEVKKVVDQVTKELFSERPKKLKDESTENFNQRIKDWETTKGGIQKYIPSITKEVQKRLKEGKYQELAERAVKHSLIESLNQVFNYVGNLLSIATEGGEKQAVITSINTFFDVFKSLISEEERKEFDKLFNAKNFNKNEKLFRSMLSRIDPVNLARAMTKMKNFDYYDEAIKNFQIPQILGNFFEIAIRDSINQVLFKTKDLTELDKQVIDLFLSSNDVRLGINEDIIYEKTSTIDVEVNKIEVGDVPIYFGYSAKMKEGDQNVSLENTPIIQFLENLKTNSEEDFKKMQYIRNNILALESFALEADGQTQANTENIKNYKILYDSFEQEVIFLSIIVRYLIGFIQKVGDDQYKALAQKRKSSSTFETIDAVYFTSFIVTGDHVFSTVDILDFILQKVSEGINFGSNKDFIKMDLKKSNTRDISTTTLEELWKNKQIFLKNKKGKKTYQDIANATGVKEILLDLASSFGVSGYSTATFVMNKNQMLTMTNQK